MSRKSSGKKPLLGNSPNSPNSKDEKNVDVPDQTSNDKRNERRSGMGAYRNSRSTSRSRRNRSRSPLSRKWNNKDYCRDFLRDSCTRRDCRYYHPPNKEPQTMSWFTLCLDYQKGNCSHEDCRYFHLSTEDEDLFIETGEVSLHIIEQAMCNAQLELPTEKDQPTCKEYLKGRCKKNSCRFRHITPAEYEKELYQCIQDALESILGPPRGRVENVPNPQQLPLPGRKESLLGPVPSSFSVNLAVDRVNNATGTLLSQLSGNKPPLMSLPGNIMPMPDEGLNDVESLRRVCRRLQNQLDDMHREKEMNERRRDRISGNMRNRGNFESDDQCLMSQLNSELKDEVEKLRRRNDDLVNEIYNVDWERLCSEAKMQVQNLEDEIHRLNQQLNRLEKQNSNLKKETQLWKNYEMLVKDQLNKLQKQFFTAEREFCVSWGGGPPPLESQREAWSAIKSTVSFIIRANIHNPSTLKPPPNLEPVLKKAPSDIDNISKERRSQSPSKSSNAKPFLDPLRPPFEDSFFQDNQNIGRSNSPRHRANAPNGNRPDHHDIRSNQDQMRKNVSDFRHNSNIKLSSSENMKCPSGSKQGEQNSIWKSCTPSFSESSSGFFKQDNQRQVKPDSNSLNPENQKNFRSKGLGDERPNSSNSQNNPIPTHPISVTHMPRNISGQNRHSKTEADDSYTNSNYYPSDNLVRYPPPAKETYNTGIPGTYMNEASQKNAELHADYQNNTAKLSSAPPAPASGPGYYSNTNPSGNYPADSGYYSGNATSSDNYAADPSGYYSNASEGNSTSVPGSFSTNAAGQVPSDAQGNLSSTGNYQNYSANSAQYSSASYGYGESYGSYYDNSSKNAEIISQMYSQPPPPPPSQGSPDKTYSSDTWKSGYYG